MPVEIIVLGLSVVLLLVYILTQSQTLGLGRGQAWLMSPRDDQPEHLDKLSARAARMSRNFQETYPAFAALALALVVTGQAGGLGAAGAIVWFAARVVYIPLYLTGAPKLRTYAWMVSIIGLILMLIRLF